MCAGLCELVKLEFVEQFVVLFFDEIPLYFHDVNFADAKKILHMACKVASRSG